MSNVRRRRLALLFTLVLLTGLALSCCAFLHISSHACPGHECCAICAALRPEGRYAILVLCAALGLLPALSANRHFTRQPCVLSDTPISRRIRLND